MQIKGILFIYFICYLFWGAFYLLLELLIPDAPKQLVCLHKFLWIKLILMSWSFFAGFNSSVGALVAEKSPVDRIFTGLKSVRLIKNIAIFRIFFYISQLSRDIAHLILGAVSNKCPEFCKCLRCSKYGFATFSKSAGRQKWPSLSASDWRSVMVTFGSRRIRNCG